MKGSAAHLCCRMDRLRSPGAALSSLSCWTQTLWLRGSAQGTVLQKSAPDSIRPLAHLMCAQGQRPLSVVAHAFNREMSIDIASWHFGLQQLAPTATI